MSELKPCPLCGGRARVSYQVIKIYKSPDSVMFYVACDGTKPDTPLSGCGANTIYKLCDSEEDAIKLWNTRTPDIEEIIKKVRELRDKEFSGNKPFAWTACNSIIAILDAAIKKHKKG